MIKKEPKWVYPKGDFPKLSPRPKKVKKSKKPNLAKLKRKLQDVFNRYIRLRDCGGVNGGACCISCKTYLPFARTQAGHFWSVGAYPAVRFDERNVHVQGACCNTYRHGNLLEYQIWLIEKIGEEEYDQLKQDRNRAAKFTTYELEAMIQEYTEKVKALENWMNVWYTDWKCRSKLHLST